MAILTKHKFNTVQVDGSDTSLVRPSNWNDDHNITLTSQKLMGRYAATDGLVQEVALTGGVTLDTTTGVLDVVTGQVSHFAMATAPNGWLKANGALLSRTTYAKLFAAIGTLYGAGDGSTTFAIPDFRGYFLRGYDDGRGIDTSRVFGSVQADLVASHNHTVSDPGHAHSISDPGHGHSVYDPGHTHGHAMYGGDGGRFDGFGGNGTPTYVGRMNCDAAGTGIGIYAAGTGIGIYGAGTGISIAAAGGAETRPKNYATLICIKY